MSEDERTALLNPSPTGPTRRINGVGGTRFVPPVPPAGGYDDYDGRFGAAAAAGGSRSASPPRWWSAWSRSRGTCSSAGRPRRSRSRFPFWPVSSRRPRAPSLHRGGAAGRTSRRSPRPSSDEAPSSSTDPAAGHERRRAQHGDAAGRRRPGTGGRADPDRRAPSPRRAGCSRSAGSTSVRRRRRARRTRPRSARSSRQPLPRVRTRRAARRWPSSSGRQQSTVPVPDVVGQEADEAQARAGECWLHGAPRNRQRRHEGEVASTEPAAGTQAPANSTVVMRISTGEGGRSTCPT